MSECPSRTSTKPNLTVFSLIYFWKLAKVLVSSGPRLSALVTGAQSVQSMNMNKTWGALWKSKKLKMRFLLVFFVLFLKPHIWLRPAQQATGWVLSVQIYNQLKLFLYPGCQFWKVQSTALDVRLCLFLLIWNCKFHCFPSSAGWNSLRLTNT